MRVLRRGRLRGRLRLRFEPAETETLTALFDQLADVIGKEDIDDPVLARLFPSAYPDDADAEADYRSITESGLRSERLARIAACAGELGAATEIEFTEPEMGDRWIRTLNDLRLALGTRIGVREDEPELDPDDPYLQDRLLYHWLTVVQDALVTGLMD